MFLVRDYKLHDMTLKTVDLGSDLENCDTWLSCTLFHVNRGRWKGNTFDSKA